ncbi:MAG: murein hydrolase activator EnvC family protein [Actinomycetota bacterium]
MKIARSTVLLVVLALVWGMFPALAEDAATELQKVQLELSEVERAIKAARTEASAVGRQVAAAQTAMDAAMAAYNVAQAKVDDTIARLAETEARLAVLTAQLSDLETKLARTEIDLNNTETRLQDQAVSLYMEASAVPVLGLFGHATASTAATAVAYAGSLFAHDDDLFDAFQLLQREEERQRQATADKRDEAAASLARLETEKTQLEQDRNVAASALEGAQAEAARVRRLLDRIWRDIDGAEQHKDGLEADAARLEEEIARLQSSEGTAPSVLSWPLDGEVSSLFGYRVHPILGVKKLHTGIDISGSNGAPITASADGQVILAQSYGGYGRAVVIDHGGGLTTLYAHQSKIAVNGGQTVARGQVVGYVGCTGFCTGPHLHYEVRLDGVPVDPLQYLG